MYQEKKRKLPGGLCYINFPPSGHKDPLDPKT